MRKLGSLATALIVSSAVLCASVVCAAATTPAKPVTKPAVKGTQQLSGDQAQFGLTYTLGKSHPINVQLISAAYTVTPVIVGRTVKVPSYTEKFLVLHYLLQNPNKSDYNISWNTLTFTAIDATDTNFRYDQSVGVEANGTACNMSLKPGQKINLYTFITVPGDADIPKLMVEGGDRLVLRYALHTQGKPPKPIVKPLPAPYADPADPSGYTALSIVPVQMGTYYPYGVMDVRVDSAAFTPGTINGKAAPAGTRYLSVLWAIRNTTLDLQGVRWNTVDFHLTDVDGVEVAWSQEALAASRDVAINQNVNPKAELKARTYFRVPDGVQVGTLTLRMGSSGRYHLYDLSAVK